MHANRHADGERQWDSTPPGLDALVDALRTDPQEQELRGLAPLVLQFRQQQASRLRRGARRSLTVGAVAIVTSLAGGAVAAASTARRAPRSGEVRRTSTPPARRRRAPAGHARVRAHRGRHLTDTPPVAHDRPTADAQPCRQAHGPLVETDRQPKAHGLPRATSRGRAAAPREPQTGRVATTGTVSQSVALKQALVGPAACRSR